jgi:hypothetical protein
MFKGIKKRECIDARNTAKDNRISEFPDIREFAPVCFSRQDYPLGDDRYYK